MIAWWACGGVAGLCCGQAAFCLPYAADCGRPDLGYQLGKQPQQQHCATKRRLLSNNAISAAGAGVALIPDKKPPG